MDKRDTPVRQPSKCSFRVLKASWGIRIDLVARTDVLNQIGPAPVRVTPSVFVAADAVRLSKPQLECLLHGARIMSPHLEADGRIQKPVVITVTSVDFNPCDFQDEGLTAVMVGWICQEFELSSPEVAITYEGVSNRYRFAWAK